MAIGWCRIVPFLALRALPEPLVPSYLYPPRQGWLVWGVLVTRPCDSRKSRPARWFLSLLAGDSIRPRCRV